MTPPRWPFLVELDHLSQLNLFIGSNHETTMPVGMRVVCKNLERDTYFAAPWGLHLLYRRLMKRYQRAQEVLMKLRAQPQPIVMQGGLSAMIGAGGGGSYSSLTGSTVTYQLAVPTYPPAYQGTFISSGVSCPCTACQSNVPSTTQTP